MRSRGWRGREGRHARLTSHVVTAVLDCGAELLVGKVHSFNEPHFTIKDQDTHIQVQATLHGPPEPNVPAYT